ncbi:hypothetical protein M422DRAFT_261179 [Sphaerobolus stellatus SS14]|uniref:Uncharacterized protein n=1 Tax=Sphaerobolus stellatus (strain SS14) TaxID=990650 RepID=A0A0C9VFT7_SPHS4|nr:hypothetical protein M422DRAFT_261179 [Sphaerobolus stellatus SS14]
MVMLVHLGRNRRAKVPKPQWDEIAKSEGDKLRPFIDPEPQWIVDGEAGKRDPSTHFCWQGQQDTAFVAPRKPKWKRTDTSNDKAGELQTEGEEGKTAKEEGDAGMATGDSKKRKAKSTAAPRKRRKKGEDDIMAKPTVGEDDMVVKPPPAKKPTPKPRPVVVKGKAAMKLANDRGESDSEEEDNGAFVIKGKPSIPHGGDYERWFKDFTKCTEGLDWEGEAVKTMECDVVSAAMFIEATELQDSIMLVGTLDVTKPPDVEDDGIGLLLDAVMDSDHILPVVSTFGSVKKWADVCSILLARAEGVLEALRLHPTDKHCSFLKVGGQTGLFPALRCLEFAR